MTYPKLYSLNAREIVEADVDYLYQLRNDARYNKFISKIDSSPKAQLNYIRSYNNKNKLQRNSFYFILENKDKNQPCGTVRLYNFRENSFEWGSWILDGNKTRYAALETAILVYDFAFRSLNFSRSEFKAHKENRKVLSYHMKSGAQIVCTDAENVYFQISAATALKFADDLRAKLRKRFLV